MSRSRRVLHGCAAVAVLALLAACVDQMPTTPDTSPQAAVGADAERAALEDLTRAVAMALQDNGLRQRIKNDMRASRYTVEHKLEFRRYVRGRSGGILLARMAKATGKRRGDLLALIESVRPLEFYMPVPDHREHWTGGEDLLVAGSLDETETTVVGYKLAGEEILLSGEEPPETPTLVLVPVEADFSSTIDPAKYINQRDQDGASIGTYHIAHTSADNREGISSVHLADECDPETSIIPCPDPPDGGPTWQKAANSVQQRGISVEEFI